VNLKTNEERDQFIERFWRDRNPDPNAPANDAKQTHYQRLEYARIHFDHGNTGDGWRSDRGMVYITLGPPQQIEKYPETRELRPLEIWFYQNLSGALPTYFYLIFFKRSPAEDYELYSPYGDRPQKLINSTNAINDDLAAIKLIKRDINDQAAHTALSLIPSEPVDFAQAAPSLQSDVLLNNIRNYRNLPLVRESVELNHTATESVSHRLLLGTQFSDLSVIATRDRDNQSSIHFLLRLLQPDDFSLTQQADGRYYYSLQVETKLSDATGKTISENTQSLASYVKENVLPKLQGKCFGVEGRLSVPPGRYELTLTLTNRSTNQTFRQARSVLVPDFANRIGISQLFFADPQAPALNVSGHDPFSFSGVRLRPIGSDNCSVMQGDALRVIFQIWSSPGSPMELRDKKIQVHYLIGKLDSQVRVEEDQEVDRGSFTPEGALLVGKDLRTDTLFPGTYRLVVRVTDPETSTSAYQSLNFEIRDKGHPVPSLWTLEVPPLQK
jgi:GWxTD domain-containing protein